MCVHRCAHTHERRASNTLQCGSLWAAQHRAIERRNRKRKEGDAEKERSAKYAGSSCSLYTVALKPFVMPTFVHMRGWLKFLMCALHAICDRVKPFDTKTERLDACEARSGRSFYLALSLALFLLFFFALLICMLHFSHAHYASFSSCFLPWISSLSSLVVDILHSLSLTLSWT